MNEANRPRGVMAGPSSGSLPGFRDFRRLVVRDERSAHNSLGFVHLGCILILILLRQQR